MNVSFEYINNNYTDMVKTAAAQVDEYGAYFLRTKIREASFFRAILDPEPKTWQELIRGWNEEEPYVVVHKEPDATAFVIDFRGETPYKYVEEERYPVYFKQIQAENYEKDLIELKITKIPLIKILKDIMLKEIAYTEDKSFMQTLEAAVNDGGKILNSSNPLPQREDFVNLMNLLDGDKLKTELILMSNVMFNNIQLWNYADFGEKLVGEVTVNGLKIPTLFGRKLITTNKTDLVPEGVAYAFTAREFLGHSFKIEDVNFYTKTDKKKMTFTAWEFLGASIGNSKAVAKLVLA